MSSIREPVVAGAFYPGSADALSAELARLFSEAIPPNVSPLSTGMGLIVPHAGYMYSGGVAAVGYRELAAAGKPEWAIILGSNHTGMGRPISLAREGYWRTPLGLAPIATGIADQLITAGVPVSEEAFFREHSIEVQLPFLQYLFGPAIPFVPVCLMLPPFPALQSLGETLANLARAGRGVIIVSSDFTHYEPDEVARSTDQRALKQMIALDGQGFYRALIRERLTICGGAGITSLLVCARSLGWKGRLLTYATSGDVTGDRHAVVGYAALSFTETSDD